MGSISRAGRRRSRREEEKGARPEWATPKEFARIKIQSWLQDLLVFARRTEQVGELLLQLCLHGLAQGDFERTRSP